MQSACQSSAYTHYARAPVLQLKQKIDYFARTQIYSVCNSHHPLQYNFLYAFSYQFCAVTGYNNFCMRAALLPSMNKEPNQLDSLTSSYIPEWTSLPTRLDCRQWLPPSRHQVSCQGRLRGNFMHTKWKDNIKIEKYRYCRKLVTPNWR
jgi:hypothetical protein